MIYSRRHNVKLSAVLCFALVFFVSYYAGKLTVSDHTLILLIFLAIACFWLFLRMPELGTVFLIISQTGFLGIWRMMDLPGISIPGIGTIWINDLIMLLAIAVITLKLSGQRKVVVDSPLSKWILLILLFVGLQVVRALSMQGQGIHDTLSVLRDPISWITFFVLIILIDDENRFRKLIGLVWAAALFAGLLVILVRITGWSISGITILEAPFGFYRGFKTYTNSFALICPISLVGTAYYFMSARPRYRTVLIITQVISGIAVFLTGFRSFITFYFSAVFLLLVLSKNRNRKTVALLGVTILVLIATNLSPDFRQFLERYISFGRSTLSQLREDPLSSHSIYHRLQLFEDKWKIVENEGVLCGAGFKYDDDPLSTYRTTGADDGLAHLLMRMGILGTLAILTVWWVSIKRIFTLIKLTENRDIQGIYKGILVLNFMPILSLFFSNAFWASSSICSIVLPWAGMEMIHKFYVVNNHP